jgi:hypothetical protein
MQDLGTLGGYESLAYGVSADGSVVVGWAENAAGQVSCLSLDGVGRHGRPEHDLCQPADQRLGLGEARAISPDGRYIVGWGYNAATRRGKPSCWIRAFRGAGMSTATAVWTTLTAASLLFAFGGRGYRNEDLNWDGTVDDADLLEVLFNFGSGC